MGHCYTSESVGCKEAPKLNPVMIFSLLSLAAYYPCAIALLIMSPWTGLAVVVLKTVVQALFQMMLLERLEKIVLFLLVPFYEIYSAILTISLLIFYILPIKINWKGRTY